VFPEPANGLVEGNDICRSGMCGVIILLNLC